MKAIVCVDFSSYTQKVLEAAEIFLYTRLPPPEVKVLHILDQSYATANSPEKRQSLINELKKNSQQVFDTAKKYLGEGFVYIEEFGMPKNEIDKILENTDYDLVIIGTRGRSIMANVFLGSIAEHLLHTADKPLLIVP